MIEFSVDACDEATYGIVRKGLDWQRLLRNVRRALVLRDELKSQSKIVASGINQKLVDIHAGKNSGGSDIGIDNFISRKFLTWGNNTQIDPTLSADDSPTWTPQNPCPLYLNV